MSEENKQIFRYKFAKHLSNSKAFRSKARGEMMEKKKKVRWKETWTFDMLIVNWLLHELHNKHRFLHEKILQSLLHICSVLLWPTLTHRNQQQQALEIEN